MHLRGRAPAPRELINTPGVLPPLLARTIAETAGPDGTVRLLEAGCGQRWNLEVPDVELRITGIDLDAEALEIRRALEGDLEDYIVGDIRTTPIPTGAFDAVYCSFLLEHVEGAEGALDRLVTALRPGGRLILKIPDGRSVYGFASKYVPFRFHVAYKRYVEGFKDAGKPGHAPYPVVYDPVVSLEGLRRYADEHGLRIVMEAGLNTNVKLTFGRAAPAVEASLRGVALLSGRRLTATHNDLAVVLEVPG